MLKLGKLLSNITYSTGTPSHLASITKLLPRKHIHFNTILRGKLFLEVENQYAYKIMENKGYTVNLDARSSKNNTCSLTTEQYKELLQTEWSRKSPQELYETFSKLGVYCAENNICITKKEFDAFIDHLTDNIQYASEEELDKLFYSMATWPYSPSIRSRNFIEVWTALDEECLKRMGSYTFSEIIAKMTLFYLFNVSRYSDFTFKAVQKLASKSKQLTPSQLVQTFFSIGLLRKAPSDMHLLGLQVEKYFDKFSIDDLAIISMGYFKSKTPIKNIEVVRKIINVVSTRSSETHEVSLAALLKIIRLSLRYSSDEKLYNMLDALQHQIHRLSVMCCVHVALCGASTLTFHKECLDTIANTVSLKIKNARLKDLERLAFTFGTFNYIPSGAERFMDKIVEELRSPQREHEIHSHGRSLACCLSFLALLEIYPLDLINKVLDPAFLEKSYGPAAVLYGREILHLNNLVNIYFNDSVSNRLHERQALVMAKKYTDYIPDENYKKQYNVSEKMMLDVINVIKTCRGEDHVAGQHILTHHQRGDLILCCDSNGNAMPTDKFPMEFGPIHKPPDDNNWIVLVIVGRNGIIKYSTNVTGPFIGKVRDLKALGFKAVVLPFDKWTVLTDVKDKYQYIESLVRESIA